MLWWIVILITIPISYGQVRETEYECGAHGRFEYCIDGIPGCVIGCHCHPGYYFDTDTKICEPNIRLVQNYRRNLNLLEPPTRAQQLPPTTQAVLEEPATTISNTVDEKIDIIAKDADDLGDWLYNQFFKTIENQVINKTEDESIPARRSGSSPTFLKKPARRSHKYWKAKKKRKKKRKGLKGKLLRITEDDSLFDSSASSDSDESSDSGSSSSSSDTSDDTKERRKDNDHGHKKIVVFNKRPKPPLPSFIFLPNMETPFFPPIGLPPPPMPMYPMVPVPPMMPFPCSDQTTIAEATAASTATNPVTTTTTLTTSTTAVTENNIEEENIPTEIGDEVSPDLPNPLRNHQKMRGRPRQKLMKKIRDKMKRKSKLQNYFANEYQEPESLPDYEAPSECTPSLESNRHKPVSKLNMEEELRGLQDVDFKYISQLIHRADLNKTDHSSSIPTLFTKNNLTLPMPVRRNYYDTNDISQIIGDLASQPVNHISDLPQQINTYNAQTNKQVETIHHRKKIEDTNDLYYANLGRQIASMIRNIDADKEVDIEIEKSSSKPSTNSFFTGNSYGSRSYWERSVRSPLKYLTNSFKKEINFLKKSNENLYSLENKVEIAASTEPPLSLHELENIISKMEKAKSKLILRNDNSHYTKSSKTSFNVNLLPGNAQTVQSNEKAKEEPRNIQSSYYLYNKNATTKIKNMHLPLQVGFEISRNNNVVTGRENAQSLTQSNFEHTHDNNDQIKQNSQIKNSYTNNANIKRHNAQSPLVPELDKSLLTSFRRMLPDANYHRNGTALEINILTPAKKRYTVVENPHYKLKNNNFKLYAYTVLPIPLKQPQLSPFMEVTTSKPLHHQLKPITIQKGANYYFRNNNNPLFEKAAPPLTDPTFSNNFDPFQFVQPFRREVAAPVPYFHHELHNFDYFDDLT